jgi:hypothetical protein
MGSDGKRPDAPYRAALTAGSLVAVVALVLTLTVDKAWVILLIVTAFALASLMFWLARSQRGAAGRMP